MKLGKSITIRSPANWKQSFLTGVSAPPFCKAQVFMVFSFSFRRWRMTIGVTTNDPQRRWTFLAFSPLGSDWDSFYLSLSLSLFLSLSIFLCPPPLFSFACLFSFFFSFSVASSHLFSPPSLVILLILSFHHSHRILSTVLGMHTLRRQQTSNHATEEKKRNL